jgi:hypothetical protein
MKRRNVGKSPGGISKEKFARMVAAHLHQAGEPMVLEFDAQGFALNGAEKRLHLTAFHRAYLAAPPGSRREILDAISTAWFGLDQAVPDDFEEVRSRLMPTLRRRGSYECDRLEMGESRPESRLILGEHYSVGVAIDSPDSVGHLSGENLGKWGISLDDALELALSNLRGLSEDGFEEVSSGLWISPWDDVYNASRLSCLELIEECAVNGRHVAVAANPSHLIVTGSDDLDGLERMASTIEELYSEPRFISGIPLVLDRDGWRPFQLPQEHPLARRYQSLWHLTMATDYRRQKELLAAKYESDGESVFVASCLMRRDFEWATASVWTETDTLLPRTQLLAITTGGPDVPDDARINVAGEWDRVREIVGELMEPLDIYPERYRVRTVPTPEQLKAIRGDGPDLYALLCS